MDLLKKKTIIYFIIVVIALLADIIVPITLVKVIAELIYFVFGIMVIVNSVILIKKKEYSLGIIFLIICSILILILLVNFAIGLVAGFQEGFQEGFSATGNAFRSIF